MPERCEARSAGPEGPAAAAELPWPYGSMRTFHRRGVYQLWGLFTKVASFSLIFTKRAVMSTLSTVKP